MKKQIAVLLVTLLTTLNVFASDADNGNSQSDQVNYIIAESTLSHNSALNFTTRENSIPFIKMNECNLLYYGRRKVQKGCDKGVLINLKTVTRIHVRDNKIKVMYVNGYMDEFQFDGDEAAADEFDRLENLLNKLQ